MVVVSAVGGAAKKEWQWGDEMMERRLSNGGGGRRVEKRECGDRVDRAMRIVFGFHRKSPPENFFGGGVVAGGWPEMGRERGEGVRKMMYCSLSDCFQVSDKTEKLSGMSFYIKLL
ncbi:hypothetical protein Tco_0915484 [Tanacetum coccineum]